MERRKRIITARMVRRGSPEEKAFDRQFWQNAGHEARFAAAWEMVSEVGSFRGESDGGQSGLQRSVQNIQRRKC